MAGATRICCHLGAFCVHHTTMHRVTSCKATMIGQISSSMKTQPISERLGILSALVGWFGWLTDDKKIQDIRSASCWNPLFKPGSSRKVSCFCWFEIGYSRYPCSLDRHVTKFSSDAWWDQPTDLYQSATIICVILFILQRVYVSHEYFVLLVLISSVRCCELLNRKWFKRVCYICLFVILFL